MTVLYIQGVLNEELDYLFREKLETEIHKEL